MILGFTKMDCFDDDFAPLQSSEPVAPPPAEDDDAPLFLGDEDVDVEKPQSVENNDVVTRCKVPTFLFISVYLTFCFNLIVELFRYSKEISKNQPKFEWIHYFINPTAYRLGRSCVSSLLLKSSMICHLGHDQKDTAFESPTEMKFRVFLAFSIQNHQ